MAAIKRKQRWKANVVAATKTDHEEPVRVPPIGRPPTDKRRITLPKLKFMEDPTNPKERDNGNTRETSDDDARSGEGQ